MYPATQSVEVGQDAVVQCRDEGDLRTEVIWHRADLSPLPASSLQDRGRLELYRMKVEDGGDFTCSSLTGGGRGVISRIVVRRPQVP